jgi:surface antigen
MILEDIMRLISLFMVAVFLLALTSCAETNNMSKGTKGALGGAAGGALIGQAIGRTTEATLIGVAVGTMLGYIVGNEMDKYDRQQLNNAYEQGKSNQPVTWVNPDTGNNYQVTPKPAYKGSSTQQVCREAEIEATIDGKPQKTVSTACRNAQGQWVLTN